MHDAAAASSAPPQTLAAARLAPGFRFHPTDEELVSYYLTRRVRGRDLRVDAIAEVDLYKCEPWELPGLSRLRTRDLEWYFFSPLDRKYASRSRNNRATAQGYWKTTGKDRPVRRGGRVVGMKKTLVYHSGRAPHGARTNWVMHEYRLEDDELAKFGVSQDAYVVCRIFQKNGAGPQNGAQYGAPFIEEEWEEDEKIDGAIEMMPDGGADEINDAHDQDFVEVNDFIHSQDIGDQQEIAATFLADDNQQDSGNCAEDPTSFLDEIFEDPSFIDDIVDYINQSDIKGRPALTADSGEQILLEYSSHNSPIIDGGYLEFNDMGNTINMDYQSSPRYLSSPLRTSHALYFADGEGESINIQEVLEAEFLENTDPSKSSSDQNLLFEMAPVQDLNLLTGDPLNSCDCPSHQAPQDMVHYDAYTDPVALKPDVFTDQNEVLYSPVADQHDNDFDDELIAYFDAIDDNLQFDNYVPLENFEQSPSILTHSNSKVHIVNGHANGMNPLLSDTSLAAGAPSILPTLNNQLEDTHAGRPAGQDVTVNRDNRKTITSHLVNFLGSVSAPPAFASEFPASPEKYVGQISGAYKASSLHVSPALVKLHYFTATSSAEDWLCKNGNTGLLLSYGLVDNLSGKTSGFGLSKKLQEWIASLLLRCGCYPYFLSGLVLTVSYKLGMCLYEKYN